MAKNKLYRWMTGSNLVILLGIIILIAGIYFEQNDLTSSGPHMSKSGGTHGTGTINGFGMVFCAVVIMGFGYMIRDKKNGNFE